MKQCPACAKHHNEQSDTCISCQEQTVLLGVPLALPVEQESVTPKITDTTVNETTSASHTEVEVQKPETSPVSRPIRHFAEDNIGRILFERYAIERILGKGGMGTVYLANDLKLPGKKCAIKEVKMEQKLNQAQEQQFSDEAQMLVQLKHPYIPQIIDYQKPTEDGYVYIIMDFVDGITLDTLFKKQQGKMPYSQALKYIIQLCNIFEYLHGHNPTIVYRDLKPSNIMIDEKDNVQLIDFGIARNYQEDKSGDTVNFGTMGFAAPEQYVVNMQTDHRTDLYALGATMYYLFSGGKYYAPLNHRLETHNKELPEQLYAIIHRLLEQDPYNRYQSAKDVKNDLMKIGSKTTETSELNDQPSNHVKKPKKKGGFMKKVKAMFVLIMIVAVLGGGAFGYYLYEAKQHNPEQLVQQFEKAIIDEDKAKLVDLLVPGDDRLTIDETSIQVMVDYLTENPTKLPEVISHLESQASDMALQIDGEESNVSEPSLTHFLNIVEGDKLYYVINTYKVELKPAYANIEVDYDDVKMYVGDQELAVSSKNLQNTTIGPLVPGDYLLRAEWVSDVVTLKDEQSVTLLNSAEEASPITFNLGGETVYIHANYDDARIFVNDKDTGKTAANIQYYGPVLTDGSMEVYAQMDFPWESVKSESHFIENTGQINLEIEPITEQVKQAIYETGKIYGQGLYKAMTEQAVGKMTQVSKGVKADINQLILRTQNEQGEWSGEFRKVVYDVDSIDFYLNNMSAYEVSIKATFYYKQTTAEGIKNLIEHQQLQFIYDETIQKWIVDKMTVVDTVSTENQHELLAD